MHRNLSNPTPSDQASRLRELASCNLMANEANVERMRHCEPRVVMLGEMPNLQRGYSMAWYLAHEFARRGDRCLIVDLSASASLLPSALKNCNLNPGEVSIQALWHSSSHGRTLNPWRPSKAAPVDILAQSGGDCPTADQMQRICEQLIRNLAQQSQQGKMPYQTVFLLSGAHGIPMDGPCWQVADDVLLLWSAGTSSLQQLSAAIESRLAHANPRQRTALLQMRSPTLRDWSMPKRSLRELDPETLDDLVSGSRLAGVQGFDVAWPLLATTSSRQRLQKTAGRITTELCRLPISALTRQAS